MTRQSQANFYVVNADGSVAAVFPGGLEIPIPSDNVFHLEKSIRWIPSDGGSLVATIEAADTVGGEGVIEILAKGSADQGGEVQLVGGGGSLGSLDAKAILEVTGRNSVKASIFGVAKNSGTVDNHPVTIIDGDNQSSFLRSAVVQSFALRLYAAVVTGAGAQTNTTDGFTITRTGIGRYTFNLLAGVDADESGGLIPFAVTPFNNVTQIDGFVTTIGSASQFTYGLNTNAGAAVDSNHMIACLALMSP